MRKDIFQQHVKNFIEKHKEYYEQYAIMSSVIVKENDIWRNCLTKIVFLKKFEKREKREKREPRQNVVYDTFALLDELVSLEQLNTIIETIELGFVINGFNVKFEPPVDFEYKNYETGNNDFSEYPGNLYAILGGSQRPINYPTVKHNVLCYKDGYHAIKDWIPLIPFHNSSDSRLGTLLLFLPNFKARIKSGCIKEDKLKIEVEGDENVLKSLQCQIVVTMEGKEYQGCKNFEGKQMLEFGIKHEPDGVYVQLVTSDDEKIDYYDETPYKHTGRKRLFKKEIDTVLMNKIKNGENDVVEFKPFIDISNPKNKKEEVIETVIAFSNTRGGTILFGVTDHCEIQGITKDILKNKPIPSFIEEYKPYLKKILKDGINKGVVLEFKEYEISGKQILEVMVTEGRNKVYCKTDNGDCYIRKGSTNRKPDIESELPQLLNKR